MNTVFCNPNEMVVAHNSSMLLVVSSAQWVDGVYVHKWFVEQYDGGRREMSSMEEALKYLETETFAT